MSEIIQNESLLIKIINLDHRKDRREESEKELKKININIDDIFHKAKYEPEHGLIGCAYSHSKVIFDFLYNTKKDILLVMEDDFEIFDEKRFIELVNKVIYSKENWDVFLLGHNQAIPIETTSIDSVNRVINAQTASGYIVKRNYAPKLIKIFLESANKLEQYNKLPTPNKELAVTILALDMYWKKLQVIDYFIAAIPALIKQRKSYSDIAKDVVDYNT
jgi:GR25 family glycosyltransferase involved in LPS biosynthesis